MALFTEELMRVALLSYNARGGDAIGNQVVEKFTFFHERGADVRVLVEDDHALHPALRGHAHAWPQPQPTGELWDFLAGADLVCVEFGQHYELLNLLPLLAGGRGRVLLDYHGVTPPELWGPYRREALAKGVRQRGLVWGADVVLAHSRYTYRELAGECGLPEGRLRQLAFPLDVARWRAGPVAVDWRARLGLAGAQVLLYVGRLAANKRVPVLVEALRRLPAVHALLVGDATDLYAAEARRCRDLAEQLGVAGRLHWLGPQTGAALRDAYRAADVLVIPSLWESYCLPVVEAMACGLPVVAARAAALPETVGGAGLTFTPDDADDLARQVRRVLDSSDSNPSFCRLRLGGQDTLRVAVVSIRYGNDFAGGAEASLRCAAEALYAAGCRVEVFTTRTRSAVAWANDLPAGTTPLNGVPVHRFAVDPHDVARHHDSVRTILQSDGRVNPETERDYLRHSLHSAELVAELRRRAAEFDAILVGPYLYGLTFAVAEALPDQTIVVPCFHDEPMARLSAWRPAYERVGGVLYHSAEEQHFAEAELGLNHPGAAQLGTWLDLDDAAPPLDSDIADLRRYVIYCGRYSQQKDFSLLLDYARRYHAAHPERFTFAFAGQGEIAVPREPWARDLGFVEAGRKRALLAHAAALVQPSRHESLSLVALEAWAQGTPVLGRRSCAPVAGLLRRSGAGQAFEGYEEFAAALDDLWQRPEHWRDLGRRGREYVRAEYGSRAAYTARLLAAVAELGLPLAERMRRRGLERAAALDRPVWREAFGRLVEELLDRPPLPQRAEVDVRPQGRLRRVRAGAATVLVAVRVTNRGTQSLLPEGPARTLLHCRLLTKDGASVPVPAAPTALPALVMPGRSAAAVVAVPVPAAAGSYRVEFWAGRADSDNGMSPDRPGRALRLMVRRAAAGDDCCAPLTDAAQAALAEAARLQRLPEDYVDVTEGLLADLKRRIKRKLLGNFKHAYVDVLARQQSAYNQQLLTAVQQLAESCAALDHAVQLLHARLATLEAQRAAGPTAPEELPLKATEDS
jgi:glycosyltransferase involved in cell wall biosynthesis